MELARVADLAGIDSLWVGEAPFYWDAFAILGSMARVTTRARLGTGVTSPYVRPPHLQAMSVATLDRLSEGRAFLGLGRSVPQWYQQLLGVDVGDPVAVMEETMNLLRQWWKPPYTASSNGHFPVYELKRQTWGVQPHLPIYLAAAGPKMISIASRLADGVVFLWPSLQFVRDSIRNIRSEASAAGRDTGELEFIIFTGLEVTDQPEMALERFKSEMAMYHSIPGMARTLAGTTYDVPSIIERVRHSMRTQEILDLGGWTEEFSNLSDSDQAREAIPTGLVDQVAIVGNADTVRNRLADYEAVGVTHFFVPSPRDTSVDAYTELLASFQPAH